MTENTILDKKRLESLESFDIMDSGEETIYNDITALAATICNTPISLISLVDDKRQYFKSHHGIDFNETPIEQSFCKHLITNNVDVFIVENTHKDKRFINNLLVTENPNIGFYAGVSLTTLNGKRIGTLCVLDYHARQLNTIQLNGLKTLAKQVVQLLELRKSKNSEEKQKNELERKANLLDNIVKATQIGIWERNFKTNSFTLNSEGLNIIGYQIDDNILFNYNTWESYIHQSDLSIVKENLNICFNKNSETYDIQYRMYHKNGHLIWVNENGKVLTWDKNNDPVLMFGTIQDITEKVNYNTELVRLKKNHETIINNTKDLIWSVNTEFKLIAANSSFQQLITKTLNHEFKEGDYVFSDKFEKEINKKWKGYYKRAFKGEKFSIKEKIQDSLNLWITHNQISFNPLYDREGKLLGVTCFSKDITSDILSQQVLLSEKEEMQKIMDASLDIICTIDKDGYFISINKVCEKIWGYKPEDLIGKKHIALVFEEDRNSTEKISKSILSGEKITAFENRYIHKNNTIVPMLWSANWDNKEGVIYCIARDITEKKKADQQLEQSERRFKTLAQEGSDMICILDHNANFTYASPASTRILKITPEEFIGTNAFEYVHLDDYESVQNQFNKILEIPQIKIKPFRFKHKEDNWIWMETIVINKFDDPSINGIVVISRDITEKKKAEQQLEQSEQRFKTLVQEGTELIAIFNQEAKFTYVSPTSKNTLKISPEDLLGTSAFDHIHIDDYETVYAQFLEATQKRQVYIKPFRFKNGEGDWRWLETIATNKQNEPTINGIVVNTRDVTDRILHLRAIEEQNTKLKEIAWTQSHIVRAPVARLMGLVNLLRDEKENLEFEEKERMLQHIIKSADEIDAIIKKIVDNTSHTLDIEEIE